MTEQEIWEMLIGTDEQLYGMGTKSAGDAWRKTAHELYSKLFPMPKEIVITSPEPLREAVAGCIMARMDIGEALSFVDKSLKVADSIIAIIESSGWKSPEEVKELLIQLRIIKLKLNTANADLEMLKSGIGQAKQQGIEEVELNFNFKIRPRMERESEARGRQEEK